MRVRELSQGCPPSSCVPEREERTHFFISLHTHTSYVHVFICSCIHTFMSHALRHTYLYPHIHHIYMHANTGPYAGGRFGGFDRTPILARIPCPHCSLIVQLTFDPWARCHIIMVSRKRKQQQDRERGSLSEGCITKYFRVASFTDDAAIDHVTDHLDTPEESHVEPPAPSPQTEAPSAPEGSTRRPVDVST